MHLEIGACEYRAAERRNLLAQENAGELSAAFHGVERESEVGQGTVDAHAAEREARGRTCR